MQDIFYIDKSTGTFADTLVIFGWARLLYELQETTGEVFSIRIQDCGAYHQVVCDPALDVETLQQKSIQLSPAPAIVTLKNRETVANYPYSFDYEGEKEQRRLFLEFRQKQGKDKTLTGQEPAAPHQYWEIARAINPAALPGYNNLLLDWWATRSAHAETVVLLAAMFGMTPNNVDSASAEWRKLDKANGWGIAAETTALQLYNPDQGKGQNRPKPQALGMSNVKNFWLLEFLKAVGFYDCAQTRLLRGVKDRKTYVLSPKDISYIENASILQKFQAAISISRPAITSDIMALVAYLRAMLDHAEENQTFLERLLARSGARGKPRNLVSGFHAAFYKDLGNAVATMNLSFIALPGWIELHNSDDVEQIRETLKEIEQLTWSMDESHSDAYRLLGYLRDFLAGDNLSAFFDFTSAYPAYLIGRRERGQRAHQLTVEFIGSVIMGLETRGTSLLPIVQNEGFQNIAYAIRHSTVIPQYRKKSGDRMYEVRYGLGQELARKARYPAEFIEALSDFIHKYNAENAQVYERRSKQFRRNVTTTDIEQIVALIDEHTAPTVANLLIAYGYARFREEGTSDQIAESQQQVGDSDSDDSTASDE